MTADVTGGRRASLDHILPGRPDRADLRESASMWISDDQGRFGFPRMCVEAVAGDWNNRGVEANIAFPDGRVLIGAGGFEPSAPKLVDGRPVTLNAGPLTFECIEPLRRWTMTFDGMAYETTVRRQMAGELGGPSRRVRIEVETTMVVPPWNPGDAARVADSDPLSLAFGGVGGQRHEQLFRARGSFAIEGEPTLTFTGTGLRIHRIGVRDTGDFPGHCWQSAVFPSGKAFGMVTFPPRDSGAPAYSEAFVFDGEKVLPAKILEAPWMHNFVPHGEPVDVVLQIDSGQVRIKGVTHDSTYVRTGDPMFGDWKLEGYSEGVRLPFHQGGAHYTWEGESAYGMIERSLPEGQTGR